jgi:putative heme iron utilization protein
MVALEIDGAPAFNTYRKSVKTRNFVRDPRAAVVLLDNWQTPPSEAQIVTGAMEEADPLPPSDAASASVEGVIADVPQSVAARAQRRVDEGKRIFLRLRTDR